MSEIPSVAPKVGSVGFEISQGPDNPVSCHLKKRFWITTIITHPHLHERGRQ